MFSEKEKIIINTMKVADMMILLAAFPVAYFVDEFIRLALGYSVKAYAIGPTILGLRYFLSQFWYMALGFVVIWSVILTFNGVYRNFRLVSFKRTVWMLFTSAIYSTLASGSYVFLLKIEMASRLFFVIYAFCAFIFIVIEKRITLKVFEMIHRKGYNRVNILIVGTGDRAVEFIKMVEHHSNWGLSIVGLIEDDPENHGKNINGFKVLGRLEDIPEIINKIVVDRVIFIVPRSWLDKIEDSILACEKVGVPTSVSMDFYDLHIARTRMTDFEGFPLLEFETFYAKEWQLFIKRTMDIFLSLILLIFFSPLMIIVAMLIKATSKGPVLFKQVRCGLNGREFVLYKFRSMVINAEEIKKELSSQNEMDGPAFKIKKDPRITPIGSIIRKASIDELPQFLNVLKGDMSIVGPRPPLIPEVEHYEIWQRRRLSLKPGITCIWQVSGRNKIGFEQWMEMDLEYIDNWSLWLDIKIMFRTFFVVLTGYGAA